MTSTWKIVYCPRILNNGTRGVALIEGATKQDAMYAFEQQYAGQYFTIQSCTKLFE